MSDTSPLVKHCERASAVVATWPRWKQTLLGGHFTPRQVDQPTDAELERFCDDIREKQFKEHFVSDSIPAGASMRAKFKVASVTITGWSQDVVFNAVHGGSSNAEDNSFSEATPVASCTVVITNKALWGKFVPGQTFYADFTPVPG